MIWRSFQLDPSLPDHFDGTETEYLSQTKGMPVDQVRQMFDQVSRQAAEEGLNYDFDAAEIRRVLESDEFTAEVRADISEARALGAAGVPFFAIDRRYAISGAQPAAVFADALETAWGENQTITVLAGDGSDDSREGAGGPAEGAVCGPDGCD